MKTMQKEVSSSIIQYNPKNENYWSNQNVKKGNVYAQNFTNLEDDDDDEIVEPDRDYEDNSEPDNDIEDDKKEEMFYENTDNVEVLNEQNNPKSKTENITPMNDNRGEMFHE